MNEPTAEVTETKFGKDGINSSITIDDYRYTLSSPFKKEGLRPNDQTEKSMFTYLSSHHLIQPLEKKFINWLRNDVMVEDVEVDECGLCYFLRDFRSCDDDSIVTLATVNNGGILMILAIEDVRYSRKIRGLNHINCLVKAVAEVERKHANRYTLFNPFGLLQNPRLMIKHIQQGNKNIYCYLVKN